MKYEIVLSSEDSIQIQFEQIISEEVNRQVVFFCSALNEILSDLEGITEIVPSYCSVTVYFSTSGDKDLFIKKILKKIEKIQFLVDAPKQTIKGRLVKIPVCYENKDFAPDLSYVAENASLSEKEVIELHSSKEYLIYMLGFLPGFPYLGGMDGRLECSRLSTPRTKILSGSVAIGGKQTGLYPVSSPGGWRIIGRTPLKVFDQERNPSFLYHAGDRIKFEPISMEQFENFNETAWLFENGYISEKKISSPKKTYVCTGGIKILSAGLMTSVQDEGRSGFQKEGISQSGVMDYESYEKANRLCGNKKGAAVLETTLIGPEISFNTDSVFAITGAFLSPTLNGKPVPMNEKVSAKKGDVLSCGTASSGLRNYIAFQGGLLVPEVFNSRSTNLKSSMGGFMGRKLQSGDEIPIGDEIEDKPIALGFAEIKSFPQELLLECLKGPQYKNFPPKAIEEFEKIQFTVSPESDRMGIRFTGESINAGKTDIISDAIPFGSVQITNSGLPVVMASDRQTTGGYAKIACVTKKSMCALAQAVPGTKVTFKFI